MSFYSWMFFAMVFPLYMWSQEGMVQIEQDGRIDQLLAIKKNLNRTDYGEKRYRIQIYNGTLLGAREEVARFKEVFPTLTCEIRFETPNYKVWAGKYRTKLETERYLALIRKSYPYSFMLLP